MSNSYKALKEDFVSNLSGGSIGEINVVAAVAPAAVLLWSVLQARYDFFAEPTWPAQLTDFLLNVGCILVATTIYSSSPLTLLSTLLISSVAYALVPRRHASTKPAKPPSKPPPKSTGSQEQATNSSNLGPFPVRPFITAYRGTMMVITCASILAVDFPVFPRRFAKVETWGTSLMDVGVGSFVFSAGVVAAKAPLRQRISSSSSDTSSRSFVSGIFGVLRGVLPLLVLGVARLLSVKNLDYAEHVTEYGVHWNFFFTMAVVPLALSLLHPVIEILPGPRYAIAGLTVSLVHQVALSTGLQTWALIAPRTDLLTQNREGIASSAGYVAIYLLGMSAGTLVLPRQPDFSTATSKLLDLLGLGIPAKSSWPAQQDARRTRLIVALGLAAALYSALLLLHSVPHMLPQLAMGVSRRLANAPYVLWIAAFNCAQIAAFCLVETVCFPAVRQAKDLHAEKREAGSATSSVLGAFNGGGLLLFLAANLGTGAVNMRLDTLRMGNVEALGVLALYMGLLTLLASNLGGVKLKL